MQTPADDYFEKHPIVTTVMCWSVFLVLLVIVAEIGLRFYLTYNPDYYVGQQSVLKDNAGKTIQYPWGEIYYNSEGYPDKEFAEEKQLPRVAYVGDSVCFGIGAGYGYRISDHLQQLLPQFEHMNFGYTIDGVPTPEWVERTAKYRFDKVVYLMNLNDIMPATQAPADEIPMLATVNVLRANLDWLRNKSYLYSYLRFTLKNFLLSLGYEVHGQAAYERYPEQYRHVIEETTQHIVTLHETLKAQDAELVVVILPYEMQISEEAAQEYWKLGIRWEEAFIDRHPQKIIENLLEPHRIQTVDGYWAFINVDSREADRERNKLGQYFVYNKGDKLDWNHPNRLGQEILARYLADRIRW